MAEDDWVGSGDGSGKGERKISVVLDTYIPTLGEKGGAGLI